MIKAKLKKKKQKKPQIEGLKEMKKTLQKYRKLGYRVACHVNVMEDRIDKIIFYIQRLNNPSGHD